MQATFSYESMEDMKSMYYEQKDVNTWFAFENMLKTLQQEICEEIDREILKKLKEGVQVTCPSSSVSSCLSYYKEHANLQ